MQPKFTQRNLGHYCLKIFALALIFVSTAQFSYSQKKGLTPVPLTAQREAELHQLKAEKIKTPTTVSTSKLANDAGKVTTVSSTSPHGTSGTTAICATFNGQLDASDPVLTGVRMFRDGIPSTCAAPKGACPGTSGAAGNAYDVYTFVNPSASAQCVTINLSNTSSATNSIFCAAYLGANSPANVCTNYLADGGNSVFQGLDGAFSFTLPGSATVTLVINTVTPAAYAAYTLTVDGICAPCAGTPAPGNTLASVNPICSGTNFTLSTQNSTAGSGVTYQWQFSTTGVAGSYINVPTGGTGATYTTSQTVATWYQAVVKCGVSGLSGTSTPIKVNMAPQSGCYCLAAGTDGTFESISNFTLGTINNSSTGTSGYENFTSISTPLEFSHPYPFTIQNAFGFSTDQAIIWIDFNQDGDFNDPGEQVFKSTLGVGPYTGTITVPAGATLGATRLRIRIHDTGFNPNATPCGNSDYGEVEDYTVVITPCTVLSAPTQPVSTSVMCGNTATFTLGGTGSFLEYEWQQNTNAATPNWTVVSNNATFSGANTNTLKISNPAISMNGYQYRVAYKGSCTPTTFSSVATLTVTAFVPTINPASATICSGGIQKLTITNLSSPAPATQVSQSGPINIPIPDGSTTGINHTLAVSALPAGATITGWDATLNIAHTWIGDMVIVLKNPLGKILNLDYGLTQTGGASATTGFTNTMIGDDGVNSLVSGANPWTGLFAPDNQDPATAGTVLLGPVGFTPNTRDVVNFAAGTQAGGNWTIAMFDFATPDAGTLKDWSLTIRYSIGLPALGTWGPTTPTNTIFTDAAATVPYVAGTPINAVWVKPGTTAGTTNYTATVTNGGACTGTATIPVTVAVRPTGLAVANKSVCTAGTTSFTVTTAAGTGNAVTTVWQVSSNGGVTYTNVANGTPAGGPTYSGATTTTLGLANVPFSYNGYLYRAILTTTACSAVKDTSNAALLTVNATPQIVLNVGPYTKLLPNLTTTITAAVSPNAAAAGGFQWFKNGVLIPNVTGNTLVVSNDDLVGVNGTTYSMNNVFTAKVADINGCASATSNGILILDSTNASKVYIYPNPNTGLFQVRYHSNLADRLSRGLNVYDDKGAKVFSKSYVNNVAYARMDVDLRAFGKGVYWVEIVDSKGNRLAVSKVVIQ